MTHTPKDLPARTALGQASEAVTLARDLQDRVDICTLQKLLSYDPESGALTWMPRPEEMFSNGGNGAKANASRWNALHAGQAAITSDDGKGYRAGSIFGRTYAAHRVAWAIFHGEWPSGEIDHINGDRAYNRIKNLRDATRTENGRNQKRPATNSSGVMGVSWCKRTGKWLAQVRVDGRLQHLGYFADLAAAAAARKSAEQEFGFNTNHGRAS